MTPFQTLKANRPAPGRHTWPEARRASPSGPADRASGRSHERRVSFMIAMTAIPDSSVSAATDVMAAVIPRESAIVPASSAPAA